ncbi:MAG: response regulator [Patescibacteria group bacterium]
MPAKKQKTPIKSSKHKRVLIVEDEHPLAHALELKLRNQGLETVIAANGKQGLDEVSKGNIDLILLDLILPGLDGFAFLEQLRGKGKKTPVIVLSNLGQEEDRERAGKFDVAEYHVKANTPLSAIVKSVTSFLQ